MHKKLTINGIEYPLNTDMTLLENLERHSIKVEFHCRDGHCGACRCKLIKGRAEYSNFPLAYCRDGEILICCSTSKNDIELSTY